MKYIFLLFLPLFIQQASAQETAQPNGEPSKVILNLQTKDCHPVGDLIVCTILREDFKHKCEIEEVFGELIEREKN